MFRSFERFLRNLHTQGCDQSTYCEYIISRSLLVFYMLISMCYNEWKNSSGSQQQLLVLDCRFPQHDFVCLAAYDIFMMKKRGFWISNTKRCEIKIESNLQICTLLFRIDELKVIFYAICRTFQRYGSSPGPTSVRYERYGY